MRFLKFVVLIFAVLIPSMSFSQTYPNIPLDQKQWYGIGEVGDPPSLYPYTGGTDYFTYMCGGIDEDVGPDQVCVNHYTDDCELMVAGPAGGLGVNILSPLGTRPAAQSVSTAPPTDAYYMISRTTAANAVNNVIWVQISQDGATAVGAANPLPISRTMAANSAANVIYGAISDATDVADVEADLTAGKPTTTNALDVASYMYGNNGATFDPLLTGAVGELQVTDVATRPGEDAANDWRKVKKEAIGTYAPIKETSGSIGAVETVVLAWKEILGYPNCTIYLKNNDAADPFVDAAIVVSPDGTNAAQLTWTSCDTLGAGSMCVYQLSNQSYRYIGASVTAAGANPVSSVDAWITCNVD